MLRAGLISKENQPTLLHRVPAAETGHADAGAI
jgi:hypothetical protein